MCVAAVQCIASADRPGNLASAADLVNGGVADGAELVVLPELFTHDRTQRRYAGPSLAHRRPDANGSLDRP